jgi:FMN phosphatase YigB (HAD superfamily)
MNPAHLPRNPRTLLLTLDAFGTLFHPRLPVPDQYAATAHKFGLPRTVITPDRLKTAFKETFKAQTRQFPNYGRSDVLRGQYGGPRQWWEEVIRGSFARALAEHTGGAQWAQTGPSEKIILPPGLIDTLLDRFAGSEGYALYDDVAPFFRRMREVKTSGQSPFDHIIIGVVSNSDDRVPAVLKSLGVRVGDMRADQDRSSMELPGFEERQAMLAIADGQDIPDVDLVITSYEAGAEKPDQLIFDVAKRQAQLLASPSMNSETDMTCVHVGDDYVKDYRAARDAGWESYLLPRDPSQQNSEAGKSLDSLTELITQLETIP